MISLSGITNAIDTNRTDWVALVMLYSDASTYIGFGTELVVDGTDIYRPLVQSIGTWSEKWNLEGDNSVTQSTPSITLVNEVYADGTGSTIETIFADTYTGNRAIIKIGVNGWTVSSYITIYDGKTDDFRLNGNTIEVMLKKSELPGTHIGGRKINGQLIGDDDYSASLRIPEEADGRYLPVPFGEHWNAPIVLYRDTGAGQTYWAYCDFDYDSTNMTSSISPARIKRDNLWQSGSYDDQLVVLIPVDDQLSPVYELAHRGYVTFVLDTDSDTSNTVRAIKFDGPNNDSETVLFDKQIIVNVPLRLYRLTGASHTPSYTNLTSNPSDSDIDKILNDDVNNSLGPVTSATDGTESAIVFNAILDFKKQLRSDALFCVNPNLPIHIPASSASGAGDEWTVLLMGKLTLTSGDNQFRSQNYLFGFVVGNDSLTYDMPAPSTASSTWISDWDSGADWENYAGATFFGRGASGPGVTDYYPPPSNIYNNADQDSGYDYFTHTRLNNNGSLISSGHNRFSFSDDIVAPNQTADAGNIERTSSPHYSTYELNPPILGELPYLRREALDKGIGFRVEFRFDDLANDTDEITATFTSLYLEAIETCDFDWTTDKYTFLKGYHDSGYSSLKSLANAFADRPFQYLELIIRRKLGAAAGDMGTEWSYIYDAFNDFYGEHRTGSGFVTHTEEEMPFDEFVKEYVKYEPYTLYRDQLGKYRLAMLPLDRTSLASRSMFTTRLDTVAYNDCDLGFSIEMSDKENLCSRIDNMRTDFVYHNGEFVEEHDWECPTINYSFAFWDADNSQTNNKHVLKNLEKRYTSHPYPSRVVNASDSTKGYCCLLTNVGTSIPLVRSAEGDVKYWQELAGTSSDWGALTTYTASGQTGDWYGFDAENRAIAAYWINQWCNRHRVIKCSSTRPEWLKYEIGDFVRFSGVPFTCLGLEVYGFNGSTATSTTVNGQDVYDYFVITRVSKGLGRVEIECLQLHSLNKFITTRRRRKKVRSPYRRVDAISGLGRLGRELKKEGAFKS